MSDFEKVSIGGDPELPLKYLPAGTLLFTYGRIVGLSMHEARAEFLRQTGQFQNISWFPDPAGGYFEVCFSRNVNKPLYFYLFPGLGYGVEGREYNIAHVCKTTVNMWVAHMRSGSIRDATTYKKRFPLPEESRVHRCTPGGCLPAGRFPADLCITRDYGLARNISATAAIDPVDCIQQPNDYNAQTQMKTTLQAFYEIGQMDAQPYFKNMWDVMMLGICADRDYNTGRVGIGYEEIVINLPYGYENFDIDFMPRNIAGIDAAVWTDDNKIFRIPTARFDDFDAALALVKPKYIIHETSAMSDSIFARADIPAYIPSANLPNDPTYNLNMNLWTCTGLADVHYLPNLNVLWRLDPWVLTQITDPSEDIMLNSIENEEKMNINDIWSIIPITNAETVRACTAIRLAKIFLGERINLEENILSYYDLGPEFERIIGRQWVQIGPINDYFARTPLIPANDPNDSISALQLLLNTIEIGPVKSWFNVFCSADMVWNNLRGNNYIAEQQCKGIQCLAQKDIIRLGKMYMQVNVFNHNGGYFKKTKRNTKLRRQKLRTRCNSKRAIRKARLIGGSITESKSNRVYKAEAMSSETQEMMKELKQLMTNEFNRNKNFNEQKYNEAKKLEELCKNKGIVAIQYKTTSTTSTSENIFLSKKINLRAPVT
jgi:hypothetical protein